MYDSAKYGVEQVVSVPEILDGTSTYTASDHVVSDTDVSKIKMFKKIKLLALRALIDTAPNAGEADEWDNSVSFRCDWHTYRRRGY